MACHPLASRGDSYHGDEERGFNLIERIFTEETAGLQAFVFPQSPAQTRGTGHTRFHGGGPDAPLPLHQGGILPSGVERVSQAVLRAVAHVVPAYAPAAALRDHRDGRQRLHVHPVGDRP